MPVVIAYLLKLSISLSLVYLFYQTLLRRLTFYHWNRWFLMGYSLLSFCIPFFNISPLVEAKKMGEVKLIQYIPVVTNYTGATNNPGISASIHSFDKWDILLFLLLIGIFVFTVRLIIQLISLRRLQQTSTLINDAGTPIYHVDKNIIPFSFGNAIYVNQQLHEPKELEEIILHEYVHVKQKHSIDILLMELVCILNWFNPFAWLLRHAVRQNLEFIADDDVLKTGMDKKAYQYHLLQVVGLPQYRIANSFNLSSLKKRIAMMNKFRSAKIHLIKFLFVLPLLALLLLAFRERVEKGILKMGSPVQGESKAIKNDSVELRPPSMTKSTTKILAISKTVDDSIPSSKKIVHDLTDSSKVDFKKVLVVIDSVQVPKGIDWATIINPAAIKSMSVYKGKSAMEKYGQKGKDGVIEITTKELDNNSEILLNGNSDKITVTGIGMAGDKKVLTLVNGVEVKDMSNVNPSQIKSVKVLKDSIAVKQYGDRGKNGVILIETKSDDYKTALNDTVPYSLDASQIGKNHRELKYLKFEPTEKPKPLYFIDGKEVEDIKGLNPNHIESINVWKDSIAVKKYGERGRNGVILIKTKKASDHSASSEGKLDQ
ncbi:MAG: TonB-dependent receptor plug domain-containing protein [Bacteroidetes bacterium]|nr:TonB-dependent receptor plug domain-containing protein [Bacteroidota bacterium]